MSDIDHDGLYFVAEVQAGYFTSGQAAGAGMDPSTLSYHARPGGPYIRVRRGLYRLKYFPTSPTEHLMVAWLPLRHVGAVISHSSALELYGLTDESPDVVHVSVPRSKRGQRPRPGVMIHTVVEPLEMVEIRTVAGVPVASPERSIVDALEAGDEPELAIRQGLSRGLISRQSLRDATLSRSVQVRRFVAAAMG